LPPRTVSDDLIVNQWACRCVGPLLRSGAGEACAGADECTTVCCPCESSSVTWALRACLPEGVCAGAEDCASLQARVPGACDP